MRNKWFANMAVTATCVAALCGACSERPDSADGEAPAAEATGAQVEATVPEPPPLPPPPPPRPSRRMRRSPRGMEGLSALEVATVPGPWNDVEVGEYVKFRSPAGMTMTRKVVKVAAEMVTLKVTTVVGEKTISQEVLVSRQVPAAQSAHGIPTTAAWASETLRIGETDVRCRVASWYRALGGKTRQVRMYLSDQVPGQIVRSAEVDEQGQIKVSWEVVEFGF